MELSHKDYLDILKFYNISYIKLTKKQIKLIAEQKLAEKLCRCIKKVNSGSEENAIAICTNSVIKRKNLKNYGFKCKKKSTFIPKKGTSKKLSKMNKRKRTRKLRFQKIHRRK